MDPYKLCFMNKIATLFLVLMSLFTFGQNRTDIGEAFIQALLVENNAEKAHAYFDASIAAQVPLVVLKTLPGQVEGQMGKLKTILEVNNVADVYYFYSEFEKTRIDIQVTFNAANKIIGFYFVPHKSFEKEDEKTTLNIKTDALELKGTLLKAGENNKKKLVIFVHGSGPQDRDETIGENKPFKNIADYLLSQGISSYRYDKKTYTYPESFSQTSTVEEETIEDAVNVAQYFQKQEAFKDNQIILLGHSQGAYLMPQIAKKAQVDKYVFLAGNARPLQELIVDQYEYLHQLDASQVSAEDVKEIKKSVALLTSKEFSLNTANTKLPMGLSAHYWKYLVDYKPLEAVKQMKAPLFFAQGGMDYQVTEKDFSLWKNQLKNQPSAQFKLYPALNHLFMKSSAEKPSPKDYEAKGSVDPTFLQDLTAFILK